MAALDATLVPDAIGGFELGPLLAQGSALDVHCAQHRQLSWTAVCKRVRRAGDADAATRLGREAAALVGVRHPALPQLHFYDAKAAVLVEEQLEGSTLSQALDGEVAIDGDEAFAVVATLGEVLDALHHAGFAHGKLQARHVLRTAHGPRLFGVGRSAIIADAQIDDQRALAYLTEALCDAAKIEVSSALRAAIVRAQSGGYAQLAHFTDAVAAARSATELKPPSVRAAAIAAVKTVSLPPGTELGSRYALPPPALLHLTSRRRAGRRSSLPTIGWMLIGATVGTLVMGCLWLVAR